MTDTEPNADDAEVQLQRVLAQLERFTSVLAHDLKAPLANVASFAQLLPTVTTLDDQAALMADRIAVNTRRAARMVDAVLDHVRRIGRPVDGDEVDLGGVMGRVAKSLAEFIDDTGASLEWSALPTVVGDVDSLAVLMRHLVDNAIRYGDPDRPPNVRVAGVVDGDAAIVTVVDDGPGVAPHQRDAAFELGVRLVDVAGPITGSGVGLATVRLIAENHGGDARLVDPPGDRGAAVELRLPAARS